MGVTQFWKEWKMVLDMGDNRWPKRVLIWSPEGTKRRRRRRKMKWEREVKRVMKQKNLTPKDGVKWLIWRKRLRINNRCNTGKL
jgi:hypothetical protein